jgi:hypothetical protein
MFRRYPKWVLVILGLIVVGIIAQLIRDPGSLIIPLVIFGVVFYLYKFPPNRARGGKRTFTQKKRPPFRVIPGNKKDDDDPPRYH